MRASGEEGMLRTDVVSQGFVELRLMPSSRLLSDGLLVISGVTGEVARAVCPTMCDPDHAKLSYTLSRLCSGGLAR